MDTTATRVDVDGMQVSLLQAMSTGLRPVGPHKHVRMVAIKNAYNKLQPTRPLTTPQIWTYLNTLWDLEKLDQLELQKTINKQDSSSMDVDNDNDNDDDDDGDEHYESDQHKYRRQLGALKVQEDFQLDPVEFDDLMTERRLATSDTDSDDNHNHNHNDDLASEEHVAELAATSSRQQGRGRRSSNASSTASTTRDASVESKSTQKPTTSSSRTPRQKIVKAPRKSEVEMLAGGTEVLSIATQGTTRRGRSLRNAETSLETSPISAEAPVEAVPEVKPATRSTPKATQANRRKSGRK